MANLDFSDLDDLFGTPGTPACQETLATSVAPGVATPAQETTTAPVEKINITQVNAPIDPTILQNAQAKMARIAVEMNNMFVERDDLIRLMILAVTTGTNLLMLGPPGTARVDIIA